MGKLIDERDLWVMMSHDSSSDSSHRSERRMIRAEIGLLIFHITTYPGKHRSHVEILRFLLPPSRTDAQRSSADIRINEIPVKPYKISASSAMTMWQRLEIYVQYERLNTGIQKQNLLRQKT